MNFHCYRSLVPFCKQKWAAKQRRASKTRVLRMSRVNGNFSFLYCERQVSRLIALTHLLPSRFSQWICSFCLQNTVTSSYRILTCFPFHQSDHSFYKIIPINYPWYPDWHLTQSWFNLPCNLTTVAQSVSILPGLPCTKPCIKNMTHRTCNSKKPSFDFISNKGFSYVREKIRTPDLLVRSQTLYPAELRAHYCVPFLLCPSQQNLL